MRTLSRRGATSKLRRPMLKVDLLEVRQLLATTPGLAQIGAGHVAYPMFQIRIGVAAPDSGPAASSYTPAQIQQAYGFNKITFGGVRGDGAGQTIAIVDAFHDPNIQADLNAFDAQFGLAATTITQVNQTGGTSYPATDSTGGWETETSLDVEWAHAVAPGAKLLLVEANSGNDGDLLAGVDYAAAHAGVVSMSWGGGEFAGENTAAYDGHFSRPGVAFVASSGDAGAPISWPAASPNVLAVGGTALTLDASNAYASEAGWSGSGGGPSAYEARPAYQAGVVSQTAMRANPDVAYDASPSTGFAVYDTFTGGGGWMQIGGTSAGAPQWAALVAIADQGRAVGSLPALNGANPQEVLTTLYKNATTGDFRDVTAGASTGTPNYSAGPGYDFVTGLGSPVADLVVQSLVGTATPPAAADHLAVAAPTADTAGSAFGVTVTALNAGGSADAAYAGTVRLGSSDAQAGLPASYTFTAADKGAHTFAATLKTAGSQSITATDAATTNPAAAATLTGIAVSPAAASQFVLAGLPSSATVGVAQPFTITARDPYGNAATGYTGTIQVTSSDAHATLPAAYTFTTADRGVHNSSVTFQTAGSQAVTVTGSASGPTATQSGIAVAPAAPINLAAATASASQINLTWTASAGATGYQVQRSVGGGAWSVVATTAAGTTADQDKGLAAGTTYTYRVVATGSGVNSGSSNTASATTTAAPGTATVVTLWSNSYTPSENSYASGLYDIGVKIRTDVAGTITGVRFYKQTWMGGYTHVGYLWSSTGALLASATFTGETSYGWEQVKFASPVAVSASTVYVASFSTGGGYFGLTTGFFSGAGVDSGPLHALADGVSGGNGVYSSGNNSFPSVGGSGMNFWADVTFAPTASGTATVAVKPLAARAVPGGAGGSVASNYLAAPTAAAPATGGQAVHASARQDSAVAAGWRAYGRAITQEPTTAPAHPKGASDFASRVHRRASGARIGA